MIILIIVLSDGRETLPQRNPSSGTGEILLYPRAIYIGSHTNGRMTRVRLFPSGEIREFNNFLLFEIDDMQVFL